jgi:hypothetical protein
VLTFKKKSVSKRLIYAGTPSILIKFIVVSPVLPSKFKDNLSAYNMTAFLSTFFKVAVDCHCVIGRCIIRKRETTRNTHGKKEGNEELK